MVPLCTRFRDSGDSGFRVHGVQGVRRYWDSGVSGRLRGSEWEAGTGNSSGDRGSGTGSKVHSHTPRSIWMSRAEPFEPHEPLNRRASSPDICPVGAAAEETRVYERIEHALTARVAQPVEAASLRAGQPEPGHMGVSPKNRVQGRINIRVCAGNDRYHRQHSVD